MRNNKIHIFSLGLWVVITCIIFIFFGDGFILNSKLGWEWGLYVVLWISLPVLYLGIFIFRWRKWIYGIYLVAVLLLIPLIVNFHDTYLHNSEEKAIREFISVINDKGVPPKKFNVNDPEELECLSNYATSTYILNGSKFFGSVLWMVEFENGQTFHIYTTRQDLSHWEVELDCFSQLDS